MDTTMDHGLVTECQELVLTEVRRALESIAPAEIQDFIAALGKARTIFCLGVGRVGLSIAALVKRLNHLGFTAYMVGDLSEPAATGEDLLIIASGSGESAIPVAIANVAHGKGVPIAYIGSNLHSHIAGLATVTVRIPVSTKLHLQDEIPSGQIMSSLFEQSLLLFSDIVALAYAKNQRLELAALWRRHANLE